MVFDTVYAHTYNQSMSTLSDLENKIIANWQGASLDDLDALVQLCWEQAKTEDIRAKIKTLKKGTHYAVRAFEKGTPTQNQLKFCMVVIRQAVKYHSFPQEYLKHLSEIIAKWLEMTGNGTAIILKEVTGIVAIESGILMICDANVVIGLTDVSSASLSSQMKNGKALFIDTGGDGTFDVKIRLIEGKEPVLQANEYKSVSKSTETIVVNAPSGEIFANDLGAQPGKERGLTLKVEPGQYKIAAHLIDKPEKFYGYTVVLCKEVA